MDAPQLAAFIAVVHAGSFTRAAAHLNVSQPTVTTRIRALEQELGATLLERLPRAIKLTAAGEELLPYARDIVTLTRQARQAVKAGGQPHGRVDVGTVESLTTYRLLPLVEYLYRRYPRVWLSMRSSACGETIAKMREGKLDCAFFIDSVGGRDDLEVRTLCPEPLVLVGAPDHPLVRRARVRDEDLRTATLVRAEHSAEYHALFERLTGVDPLDERPRTVDLDSVAAAKLAVADGLGVALLPTITVRRELAGGELRRIGWQPPFEVHTQVACRRTTQSAAVTALVTAAEHVIAEQTDGT